MTEREKEVLELAVEWRRSRFAVAEAIVRQKMVHAIDMLMKERRDAKVPEGDRRRVDQAET